MIRTMAYVARRVGSHNSCYVSSATPLQPAAVLPGQGQQDTARQVSPCLVIRFEHGHTPSTKRLSARWRPPPRVFPASSFLTCAADKLAINKALEFSSTDSGPSFAPFRRARMSLAALLHLVTLGSSGAPGPMASCRSVSRKRSQITNAGIPHAPLTNSHK